MDHFRGGDKKDAYPDFYRLGSLVYLSKESIYHANTIMLFLLGFFFNAVKDAIVCKYCGFSFRSSESYSFNSQMSKHLSHAESKEASICITKWSGQNSFLRKYQYDGGDQTEYEATVNRNENELDQSNVSPSGVETDAAASDYVESDELTNDMEVAEVTNDADGVDSINEVEVLNRASQIGANNEASREFLGSGKMQSNRFTINQTFILKLMGVTTSNDDNVSCKKCKYSCNWSIPFCKVITSHYAMSPNCEALRCLLRSGADEYNALHFLAKTLAKCLPTFLGYVDRNGSEIYSRALMLAGSGFSFNYGVLNCAYCNFQATENVSFMTFGELFELHSEKSKFCPFVVGIENLECFSNIERMSAEQGQSYCENLMDIVNSEQDFARDIN